MSAWYETDGPSAADVRKDQLEHLIKVFKIEDNNSHGYIVIRNILEEHIPDGRNDFGSWRGYSTFGLDNKLKNLIFADIHKKLNIK